MDLTGDKPQDALENFWLSQFDKELDNEVKDFTNGLVRGGSLST